ncbi:hypothetical protein [Sphaerisporangium fuscum]|uniref:hypothetical protein n=1 Tax=Sphaerisporangium fuscum TaxID=2835868 RepID=UPI001BDC74EA|nr:hypothetical protein [Sphaerisporangium fuscum]
MTQRPESPVKDKNYDLITVVQGCLEDAWRLETYKEDARRQGDAELTEWFSELQQQCRQAGDRGKILLADRLGKEGG